ncbi:MAG: hypothetical protein AB8G14_05435 [Ilumatobacter sp.]
MKKPCLLFLAAALVATSCGSSDGATTASSANITPPAADAVITTNPPPETTSPQPSTSDPVAETAPPATDPTISSDPVSIVSEDGDLTITLPGDVAADLGVSIRLLDSAELPPEIAGGDNLDSVKVYDLEPDGATFEEPVIITRRLDVTAFDALNLGPNDVPFVTLLNRDSSGTYELLDDLTMTRLGDDLFMSGTTSHFSSFVASNEGVAIRDTGTPSGFGLLTLPLQETSQQAEADSALRTDALLNFLFADAIDASVPLPVLRRFFDQVVSIYDHGESFDDAAASAAFSLLFDEPQSPVAPPTVSADSTAAQADDPLVGVSHWSKFDVPTGNAPSAMALIGANPGQPERISYTVQSLFVSAPASAFPQPFLEGLNLDISVETNHTPLESYSALEVYASFLRTLIDGIDDLPPGARVLLGLIDSDSFDGRSRLVDVRPIDVLLDAATTLDLGIECFCDYEFVLFYLDAADELAEAALAEATTLEEALAIVGAQENIGRLMFEEFPDDPFLANVTADEGSIADDVSVTIELFAG